MRGLDVSMLEKKSENCAVNGFKEIAGNELWMKEPALNESG